jgi:hypothetical protein
MTSFDVVAPIVEAMPARRHDRIVARRRCRMRGINFSAARQ